MDENRFNFEDLAVWQKAVEFTVKILDLCENIKTERKHWRLIENLEAAAISIPSNIAEGRGRQSKREFVQYIFISRGSLFEVITSLVVFEKKGWITVETLAALKKEAFEINKMFSSFIKSIKDSMC